MEQQKTLLDAATADGAGTVFYGTGMRHVILEISMSGFTGTVKIAGSNFGGANGHTPPNFGSAASVSNPWAFVKSVNLIDGAAVDGGTGLTGAVTTSVTQIEVNTNLMRWVCPIVSGYAAGSVTVRAIGASDTEY